MKTIALFSLLISYVAGNVLWRLRCNNRRYGLFFNYFVLSAGAAVKEVEEMKKDEMLEFEVKSVLDESKN